MNRHSSDSSSKRRLTSATSSSTTTAYRTSQRCPASPISNWRGKPARSPPAGRCKKSATSSGSARSRSRTRYPKRSSSSSSPAANTVQFEVFSARRKGRQNASLTGQASVRHPAGSRRRSRIHRSRERPREMRESYRRREGLSPVQVVRPEFGPQLSGRFRTSTKMTMRPWEF